MYLLPHDPFVVHASDWLVFHALCRRERSCRLPTLETNLEYLQSTTNDGWGAIFEGVYEGERSSMHGVFNFDAFLAPFGVWHALHEGRHAPVVSMLQSKSYFLDSREKDPKFSLGSYEFDTCL